MSKRRTLVRPESIAEILFPILKKKGMLSQLEELKALLVWDEVVGKKIAKKTKPERIENGVLFIKTRGAAWRQELSFHKVQMIASLNKKLGNDIVKDIKFV